MARRMRCPSPPEMVAAERERREIAEADGVEEFKALDDLALQAVGDELFAAGEAHGARGGESAFEGKLGEVGDRGIGG